jgi:outer membrane protein W
MRHLYTIFLIALLPILSFGQNAYFSTDSSTSVGIKLVDGGDLINSQFCQVKKGEKTIQYTPYEVKEFGFKDGRVYVSKEIQIADSSKRVFLERLHKGNTTLYFYRGKGIKTFFIQKDSTLFFEMPKHDTEEDYSTQLLNLTKDCSNVSDACKLVNYNKKSLSKLISRYNKCELKPFPHFKYGFLIGYEFLRLIPSNEQDDNLEYFDYKYDGGFTIGIFLDNPILVSDFSVHAELLLAKHGYSYNKLVDNKDLDFVANFTSLNIPLLFKYAYPSNKIRPFINAGIIGTYFIKNETLLYETTINETIIEINDTEITSMISDYQLGYVIGGGLEYELNYKKSLFFELRYNNQYNLEASEFLGNSVFSLLTGINF